jgi:hypothetical protein
MSNEVDIITKLMLAQVSACSCQTKTSEAAWHDTYCLYRVLDEAVGTITRQHVEQETLQAAYESMRDRKNSIVHLQQQLSAAAAEIAELKVDKARLDFWQATPAYVGGFAPGKRQVWSFFVPPERVRSGVGKVCYGDTLREAMDQLQVMHADLTKGSDTTKRH